MKITKYLLLIAVLAFIIAACSVTKTEVSNTGANNSAGGASNAGAPSSNVETPEGDTDAAVSALETAIPQSAPPEAVVKDLYKTHDEDMKGNADRILSGKSRTALDKYFDKTLADRIWKDLTTNQEEVGVLDFDPFYNAQDFDIKDFAIGQSKVDGDKASVPVSFTNAGRKDKLTYLLVRKPNLSWKITDIKYTDGSSLVGYFKEAAAAEKNNSAKTTNEEGMFEGTYQVGETTAIVKPIKMAFELKWAKGAGTMIFFYEGEGVLKYVSEDKGKGVDTFIFDDATFKSGKFIRGSDGKEMPVRKIR